MPVFYQNERIFYELRRMGEYEQEFKSQSPKGGGGGVLGALDP